MRLPALLPVTLPAAAAALAIAAPAPAGASDGATVSALRAAASTLIAAELAGDGATACRVLNAPLTRTLHGRTCAERWDARSAHLRATPGGAAGLRRDRRAVASAPVTLHGEHGSIALPVALLNGASRFYWTANCWMAVK